MKANTQHVRKKWSIFYRCVVAETLKKCSGTIGAARQCCMAHLSQGHGIALATVGDAMMLILHLVDADIGVDNT